MTMQLGEYIPRYERPYSSLSLERVRHSDLIAAQHGAVEALRTCTPDSGSLFDDSTWTFADVWHRVGTLIPPLIGARSLLRWSTVPILGFAFIVPLLLDGIIDSQSIATAITPWIGAASRTWLDPSVLSTLTATVIIVLLVRIGRNTGASWRASGLAALIALAAAMVLELLIDTLIMKPAIGVPRPLGYVVSNDPFIIQAVHKVFLGGDVPSGAVARQVVLACLLMWTCLHPSVGLGRILKFFLCVVSWAIVVVVALLRITVGAHSPEAAAVAVSSGILEFWIVAVGIGVIFAKQPRNLLPDLTQLWVLTMAGWLILAPEKSTVAAVLLGGAIGLPALGNYLRRRDRERLGGLPIRCVLRQVQQEV